MSKHQQDYERNCERRIRDYAKIHGWQAVERALIDTMNDDLRRARIANIYLEEANDQLREMANALAAEIQMLTEESSNCFEVLSIMYDVFGPVGAVHDDDQAYALRCAEALFSSKTEVRATKKE